ncbi:MAG TPA: amidinotransferase [Pseudonocardia sp.]|jgi:N-dimethylarginine dimethylaminohydrolase
MVAVSELARPVAPIERVARPRRYLMCPPDYFTVSYAINPWMDVSRAVDARLARRQWERLRRTYSDLGHTVELIDPQPGLPDMVYAANGGLVIDGKAYGARFHHAERADEGPAYLRWMRGAGLRAVVAAQEVNEGEGDFLVLGDRVLAGTGFRTTPAAHAEVERLFGRPVVSLRLVDPRFYHLDTALAVLDPGTPGIPGTIAYYPDAFSADSRRTLRALYPDAVLASRADAEALGLNAVSDGHNVVLAPGALGLAARLRERGFRPIPVDLSELLKGGGGAKCCTLELRT